MRASYAPASPSTRSPPMPEPAPTLTLAVPCRTDEPALARTLEAARAALEAAGQGWVVELLVCINGPAPAASAALRAVEGFARRAHAPQLYAARLGALPAAMPEDLIEPERWLELMVGRDGLVRVPEARVAVRLPATLGDFCRQRVRIEMGKVQLAREYPDLAARSAP